MTQTLKRRYERAAVTVHKGQLSEAISASRTKLSTHIVKAQAELTRVDGELAIRQSQIDVLRSGRERLAELISQTAAQVVALDNVLCVINN